MRRIVLLLLAVALVATGVAKPKKKPAVEVWPDQTVMDAWFKDTTKVDVAKHKHVFRFAVKFNRVKSDVAYFQVLNLRAHLHVCDKFHRNSHKDKKIFKRRNLR